MCSLKPLCSMRVHCSVRMACFYFTTALITAESPSWWRELEPKQWESHVQSYTTCLEVIMESVIRVLDGHWSAKGLPARDGSLPVPRETDVSRETGRGRLLCWKCPRGELKLYAASFCCIIGERKRANLATGRISYPSMRHIATVILRDSK